MQLRIPLWRPIAAAALAVSLGALPSCDDGGPAGDAETPGPPDASASAETRVRPAVPGDLAAIRDRADAAFAERKAKPSRSESRIGPQPWPADLPARWPRLEEGRVLADLRRDGDRLLLVDWPGDADGAVDRFDAALRAEGFDVVSGQGGGTGSLSARDAKTTAELTFFPRETVTRVEILFRERDAG
jgi:hypothetical protein